DTFNTNNNYVRLSALMEVDEFPFDIIVNPKTAFGKKVIQLEQAVSAAVSFFHSATLIVPRRRFVPVKTCRDLLLARSDVFVFSQGTPKLTEASVPIIRLGHHYKTISDFERRFSSGPPSMQGLVQLTVVGDVSFGSDVHVKGFVVLVADNDHPMHIPDGMVLENKVCHATLDDLQDF
ncbi:UTP--glucose-1-phosphate uridylyltransferase family protein, partial [Kipferlia bialata]